MDSRERTFLALDHQQPDRVPVDFWSTSGFDAKLWSALGLSRQQWLDLHEVDLRYIVGPTYIGPELRPLDDGLEQDIFGVGRRKVTVSTADGRETYSEVALSPLSAAVTVEQIDAYDHWPSPDWFDYSQIESQCDVIRNAHRVVVFMGDRLNRLAQLKPAMYIRGVEQILMDLSLSPRIAAAIFARIRDFYLAYAERIFSAANGKIDILLTGDDFGSQNGPLVSPAMWTEFLGPGFADYIDLAHSFGLKVMHHTCGSVEPIIPCFIERGLDILQSLQPEAAGMAPAQLKRRFGERLCFQGGISVQSTLPLGRPEDVTQQVRQAIDAFAPGGGYILGSAHNLQADVPIANAQALMDAYRRYAPYE
ncbi:MAG: hypothetical protein GWP14_03385 [Actinobacteria bacterium]|nr:hypothetical protein [Actinomycetota bacterium]